MSLQLSQKQIANRIMELRKIKGLSQTELAKSIGISRPSLSKIEMGKRNIDILELHKLSQVLGFSIDEFLSPNFQTDEIFNYQQTKEVVKKEIRISVPTIKMQKFKNVLLYILERCVGKPNMGETVLNKILYFCDFNYYELYEEHLTGAKYKKIPFGPVPQNLSSIINKMIENEQLKCIKTTYHNFPQKRYIPLVKPDLTQLSAAEKSVIDNVILQLSDWNANKISEYSHKDIPWLATKENEFISYNLAFYRELPYSVRVYEDEN